MIKEILFVHFFIISSFGQLVQELNISRNESEVTNNNTNNTNEIFNKTDPISQLLTTTKLSTIETIVNLTSTVVTQSSVFNIVNEDEAKTISINGRKNNNSTDSSKIKETKKSAVSEFPTDFMTDEFRNNGGFVFHILIFIYLSLALAVVCDVYFLKSLEFISSALSLPSDIAGATFMAIGTSAPELFTSVIGVFISDNDIGTGTIVGSAVFNLLVIPGACGFAAYYNLKEMPKISSFPIIRDTLFYILTIITLILCIKDNVVDWVESLTLLSLYGVYIVIMFFNAQYSHLIIENNNEEKDEKTPLIKNAKSSIEEQNSYREDYSKIELTKAENGKYKEIKNRKIDVEEEIEEEIEEWTNTCFMSWLLFPVNIIFKITLPKPTKYCYIITFIMSIVWIAVLTYVIVWMVTIVGFVVGIPDTVSGITILAAGTSIPELISSYIIVKKLGLADMAICNSIGSNIFDILFCLGVPWLLKSLILIITNGSGFSSLANTSIPIQSSALPLTTLTLLITIFAMILTFKFTKWRLGLSVGIISTFVYIVFVVVSTVLEINV